jgi:putative N6-adenine-specific DNA methylase
MTQSEFKAVAIPAKGFADVCAKEAKEILNVETEISNGVVVFTSDLVEICKYIYRAHTPKKVLMYVTDADAGPTLIAALREKIKQTGLPITKNSSFLLRAHIEDFRVERQELEVEIGGDIAELSGAKVDFKNPDVTFYAHEQEGKCWLGIDLSGEDLGKRDFRIFLGPQALKGHIAASLIKLAEFDSSKVLLDLFCRNGIIPIEAALMVLNCSPHRFGKEKFLFRKLPMLEDKDWDEILSKIDEECDPNAKASVIAMDPQFASISASKKNAKIAGANKPITFSRTDLQFLDAKFGEHAIDCLVTLTPQIRQGTPEEKVDKILKEFFYQAEFVMKKTGRMVLITQTAEDYLKKYAEDYKFKMQEERVIWQGNAEFSVMVFER